MISNQEHLEVDIKVIDKNQVDALIIDTITVVVYYTLPSQGFCGVHKPQKACGARKVLYSAKGNFDMNYRTKSSLNYSRELSSFSTGMENYNVYPTKNVFILLKVAFSKYLVFVLTFCWL